MGDVVREKPIIFSAPMVRAILAGTKTMTRRLVKPQPRELVEFMPGTWAIPTKDPSSFKELRHPYTHGDRLWVRETWWIYDELAERDREIEGLMYRADLTLEQEREEEATRRQLGVEKPDRWRSPIHMPRWASRITLEVTGVRVERLQEISHEDALAEGVVEAERDRTEGWQVREQSLTVAQLAFSRLWESIHGAGSWEANPWVWVIEFRRVGAEVKAA